MNLTQVEGEHRLLPITPILDGLDSIQIVPSMHLIMKLVGIDRENETGVGEMDRKKMKR